MVFSSPPLEIEATISRCPVVFQEFGVTVLSSNDFCLGSPPSGLTQEEGGLNSMQKLAVEVDKMTLPTLASEVGNEECISRDFPFEDV